MPTEGQRRRDRKSTKRSISIVRVHPILFHFQMRPGSAGVKQDRLLEQMAYRKELGQPAG